MTSSIATPARPDAWRTRLLAASLLPLGIVAALVSNDLRHEIGDYVADPEQRAIANPFWQMFTPVSVTLSHLILALGAAIAFASRKNAPRSRHVVLFAFALSLPLQVVPRLVPLSWQFSLPPEARAEAAATLAAAAPMMAVGCAIDLLPLLLSIAVGLSRAGLHRHAVAPEEPAGATVAFVASLQIALLGSTLAGVIGHAGGAQWLPIGLAMLAFHYAVAAMVCFVLATRRRRGSPRLRWLLVASAVLALLPGVADLAIGLAHFEVLGRPLVGWGGREGCMSPRELLVHALLFAGRSAVTAIAANDLLARAEARD